MLARILYLGGITVTIFEREASFDSSAPGGSVHLNDDLGLQAIKAAQLFEAFKEHGRYDGAYHAIVDKHLKCHRVQGENGSTGELPKIDGTKLREMLLASLPKDMVQWGHALQKIQDPTTLVFEHRVVSGFDLIVGADGSWSKVRAAIAPGLAPVFTGIGHYSLSIPDAAENAPEICNIVKRGSIMASSDGQQLSVYQKDDGSLSLSASFVRHDEYWMDKGEYEHDARNVEETKKALLENELHDWCPELRRAVSQAEGLRNPTSMYMLPIGAKWEHKPRFTLIGDAAHLMAAYGGWSLGEALNDGMLLAQTILSCVESTEMDGRVWKFEDQMFDRVRENSQLSYDLVRDWMFTPSVPESVMAKTTSRIVNNMLPAFLHPLGIVGTYSYFFLRNLVVG